MNSGSFPSKTAGDMLHSMLALFDLHHSPWFRHGSAPEKLRKRRSFSHSKSFPTKTRDASDHAEHILPKLATEHLIKCCNIWKSCIVHCFKEDEQKIITKKTNNYEKKLK